MFINGCRYLGKNAQGFDEAENEIDGTVLILIPGGEFRMGAADDVLARPVHRVSISSFWMARTPITNAQYRRFVAATGHQTPGDWEACARKWGEACPVVGVTWFDAIAYAKWAQLRLSTEAEWEYAARGASGRTYPWGDVWDASKCRNGLCTLKGADGWPTPVGAYPEGASPFGCLDMAGNIWEWCSSLAFSYPYRADDGREGMALGPRIARGGSWLSPNIDFFRGAHRDGGLPETSCDRGGFRCARSSV